MTAKPEALRLADALETAEISYTNMVKAAAELRRLHAEVERLSWDSIHTCHAECQRPLCKLTRERDALLEVVDKLEYSFDGAIKRYPEEAEVNAAIKAVEGEA